MFSIGYFEKTDKNACFLPDFLKKLVKMHAFILLIFENIDSVKNFLG